MVNNGGLAIQKEAAFWGRRKCLLLSVFSLVFVAIAVRFSVCFSPLFVPRVSLLSSSMCVHIGRLRVSRDVN